jgi:hypothetical protein
MLDGLFHLGLIAGLFGLLGALDARLVYLERQVVELRGRAAEPKEFLPPAFGRVLWVMTVLVTGAFLLETGRNVYAFFTS